MQYELNLAAKCAQHLLAQVVQAHVAAGIKIQPCKTKLNQSEVEYLGHKISKGRVSMIPEYCSIKV